MTPRRSTWAALAATTVLCGAGVGCGAQPEQRDRARSEARVAFATFPDYVDPALAYTADSWQLLWNVYTPLLTYRHVEGPAGTALIPGLAKALPRISPDGRTYALELRDGLRYADGTPVRASDFEHAIRRVLDLESGGTSFFDGIAGVDAYLRRGDPRGDISGIETRDGTGEITIRLTRPDGSFSSALAMGFAALVPSDTPFRNRTRDPPPGVGPLTITAVEPGRRIVLDRNPRFRPIPGVPAARMDRVTVEIVTSQTRQVQDVLRNRLDLMTAPQPPDQLDEIQRTARDRFRPHPTSSTYFVFLNQRVPPFDSKRVRQAVAYAIDRRALRRLFGGMLEPTCNFLPRGMAGYRALDPCPYGDLAGTPDLDRARALIDEAGATGTRVKVWGMDEQPGQTVTVYLADLLRQIGLHATPQIISGAVYFQTMGNQKTRAQAGFAAWFADFPHPSNFLMLVSGDAIQSTNNQNFSNVDDPVVDRLLRTANQSPDVAAVADEYAAVDRRVVEEAYVVPYGQQVRALLTSERIDFEGVVWHELYFADFASLAFDG